MPLKLPNFEKTSPAPRKINPLAGIAVIKCKGCKKKFVSYGKAFCSKCQKEKDDNGK